MKRIVCLAAAALLLMSCVKENNEADGSGENGSGPAAVNMGLSVKWADSNLGAIAPEDYGNYFSWGETEPKTSFKRANYTYFSSPLVLPSSADAAHAILGGKWRMPTAEEWSELIENSTITWETLNGINGALVTSNKTGASIFLPTAGYFLESSTKPYRESNEGHYWSSSRGNDVNNSKAQSTNFDFDSSSSLTDDWRHNGLPIRPVKE